jgi:dTDP-4-dehydrorhamnose 3,5-epimerase
MAFRFQELAIPGMILVEPDVHGDERGFFLETWKRSAFREEGLEETFVQDNAARSGKGVLRGLHFQHPPGDQGKLVRVSRGRVLDVGVDLRKGSPTYKHWVGVELDAEKGRLLYLPTGLAHGYLVLSEEADLAYKVTAEYAPELEAGIRWDDPDLAIDWPTGSPVLSEKDRRLPTLDQIESTLTWEM